MGEGGLVEMIGHSVVLDFGESDVVPKFKRNARDEGERERWDKRLSKKILMHSLLFLD
jgi:hypothetical protein